MLKKVSLLAVAAAAGAITLSSLAFADEGVTIEDRNFRHEVQKCDKDIASGILTVPHDDDSENNSDDDVNCDQDD